MRPRRDPVPRAKEAWWWLGGVLTLGIIGAGVVAAGVALWENIDVRQLAPELMEADAPLPEPLASPPGALAPVAFDAVVFESTSSSAFFDDPDFHPGEIARWRSLVEAVGGRVRTVRDPVELASVSSDVLLVLPEAPCLGSPELAAVFRHMAGGGNVAANWALGVRDVDCEWRGWDPLLRVTGAEDIRELPLRDGLFLTVPGAVPAATGLDAGTRIELKPEPALALKMDGPRVYWSDWALNPAPDDDGLGADVAVATADTEAGGRVAWFGLRAQQAATLRDEARLERLLRNGLAWAAGIPSASASTWPGAARSALAFVMDVEGDTWVHARDVAAVFESENTPITFYVHSQLVEDDRALAETLSAAGEVGTQTVSHAPLRGLTAQEQRMRLQRSFDDVRRWTGVGPLGLRPPEEVFDSLTLEAWRAAGGRHLLSSNDARSASPEVHATTRGPLVVLPRLLKDDYTVIVRDVTLRSERLQEAYLTGLAKMRAIGGLAVVAGHTQIISSGPRLDAFASVARNARGQGGWWTAEASEIAAWWLARSEVEIAWRGGDTPGTHELTIRGSERTAIDDLWIDVVWPGEDPGRPLVDGVSVDHILEGWGMRVRIGSVEAGGSRVVTWTDPASDRLPDA